MGHSDILGFLDFIILFFFYVAKLSPVDSIENQLSGNGGTRL